MKRILIIVFKFSLRCGWGILSSRIRSCLTGFGVSDISRQHSSLILKYRNVHQESRLCDWSVTLVSACTIILTRGSQTHYHQNMQHSQDDVCSTKLPYTEARAHPSRPTLTALRGTAQTHGKRLLKKGCDCKSDSKSAVLYSLYINRRTPWTGCS